MNSHSHLIRFACRVLGLLAGAVAMLALAGALPAHAETINFDGVADGTALGTRYPGVTFSQALGGNVYARNTTAARSPTNVVSVFQTGVPMYGAFYGAVQAEFATLQRSVSIDASAGLLPEGLGTPQNRPYLQAFDANGALLATVYFQGALPGVGGTSPYETLTFVSPTANIRKVLFSVQQGQPGPKVYGYFDNLAFSTTDSAQSRMYDDFLPSKWRQSVKGTGVAIKQANGVLDMTISPNASGASIMGRWDSTCKLSGDFDLRVDWSLPSYVPRSGVRLAMVAGDASIERTGLGPNDFYTTGDYFIQQIGGNYGGFTSTTVSSGKLRITRTAGYYRTFYMLPTPATWVQTQEGYGASGNADVPFSLLAFTGQPAFTQQQVTARFDNVQVSSGTLVGSNCP
jgi:hypothetical protein